MAELKTIAYSSIAAILVTLATLGVTNILTQNDMYYCTEKQLVAQCDRLSLTGKTCYRSEGNKICSEGWLKIEKDFIQTSNNIDTQSLRYSCSPKNCTKI